MAAKKRPVTGGVDTHGRFHHAAVIDRVGEVLNTQQFPATAAGYQALLDWMRSYGRLVKVGVEGTGSYGAGLARYLADQQVDVVEVDRPDRKTRRQKGKSDPIDAIAAALAVLSGRASGKPKARTGPVEAIRVLQMTRRGAVKARTAAINQLKGLIVTAPEPLRERLRELTGAALIAACADLHVDETQLDDPAHATAAALRTIAERIHQFGAEIRQADKRLRPIVTRTAPRLIALPGIGPEGAAKLLTAAGDNPDRLRSEAAFAHLCGVAPLPASSGNTHRHRLNRGGDRAANSALYTAVLSRLRHDPRTRAYTARRAAQDRKTTKDSIRCLKRYVAREAYTAIMADLAALNPSLTTIGASLTS
jgi:transposase